MGKDKAKKASNRRMSKNELAERLQALQSIESAQATRSDREEETQTVLHELEVTHIELEVQNRELIESRQAVEESHDKYVSLYDFAPVGYLTLNRAGTISEINLTAAGLLGEDRQRLLGGSFAHSIVESDLPQFRRHLVKCKSEGVKITSTFSLRSRRNEIIPVQLLSNSFRDRVTGELYLRSALTDLTIQKQAEDERQRLMNHIESSRKELHDFFMQAPAPMAILTGSELTVTLVNEPFVKFFGDASGRSAQEVFSEFENLSTILNEVFIGGKPYSKKEMSFTHHQGIDSEPFSERFLDVSCTVVRGSEGNIKSILFFANDVTGQVLARQRLESERADEIQHKEELRVAKSAAERANELKTAFLANMSHEIRTPLGAILGFSDLLRDAESAEEKEEYGRIIAKNGKSLTKIIDDILDLSKVEAGKLELEFMDFRIDELVQETADLFREYAKSKDLNLDVYFDPRMPKLIESDPTRVRQILVNLVGNAIKFTAKGSICIRVESQKGSDSGKTFAKFLIEDSGIGMTKEQASRLFSPFSQGDNSTTRKFGGSGLGLALSRKLARALGGDVEVQKCELGKGCVIAATIEMRPAKVFSEQRSKYNWLANEAAVTQRSHLKVLLVEDSLDNQLLVTRVLAKLGIKVDVANNGAEGVEMAESDAYDLVFMDMQMPVLDGYAATEKLRHDGYIKPIVALTAHAMAEERQRILNMGCDAHLAKPIDSRLLVETIDRFVSSSALH